MSAELYGRVLQIGKQTGGPAAPVAATRRIYVEDPQITSEFDTETEEAAVGTPEGDVYILRGSDRAGGSFRMAVNPSELPEFLEMCMGAGVVTTPAGATNARLHTHGGPMTAPSLATVEFLDALSGTWWQLYGVQISELRIEGAADQARTTVSATLFATGRRPMNGTGGNPPAPTALANRTYPRPVQGFETRFAIDNTIGAIGGNVVDDLLSSFAITLAFNPERDYAANGTRNASSVNTGMFKLQGASFVFRAAKSQALTEVLNADNSVQRFIELTLGNITAIDAGTNEVQTLTTTGGTPTSGNFILTFGGQSTPSGASGLPWNATAAQVQAALEVLSTIGIGNVQCAGGPFPGTGITVTFVNNLGGRVIAAITATDTFDAGNVAIAETTPGVNGFREYVKVQIPGFWTATDLSQSGAQARRYGLQYQAVRDATLGGMVKVLAQNARASGALWTNA